MIPERTVSSNQQMWCIAKILGGDMPVDLASRLKRFDLFAVSYGPDREGDKELLVYY